MAISYNPSSFATNKTILQAIEELKQYLIANPLACIYKTTEAHTVVTLAIAGIENPNGQELKLGDIVISSDGYYGFISTMGTSDYTVAEWLPLSAIITDITVEELTGAIRTITSGATVIFRYFPDDIDPMKYKRVAGTRLTVSYIDSLYPNGSTYQVVFGNQPISAIWSIFDSGTGDTTIYVDSTDESGLGNIVSFVVPAGATGQNGVSVTGATIDGNNHLILTLSDGNTIDAGALPTPSEYTHTVTITTTSGTFSDSDFALLGYGDSVIIYNDGTIKTAYKLKLETASVYEFECIDATAKNNLKLIDVNKGTKAYSMTAVAMIKSSTFDSGTATSGKVLTANGSGGTSWESVSSPAPEGTSVKSTGETSGKVLTADGSGGASWESVSGGTDIVEITSLTGTFSLDDYNILLKDNSTIKVNQSGNLSYFKKIYEDSTYMYFEKMLYNHFMRRITVTKSTRGYATSYVKLIANGINSEGSSNGWVLTADGNGGAIWQSVSGGSLYEHNITFFQSSFTTFSRFYLSLRLYNNNNTPINSYSALENYASSIQALNDNVRIEASGYIENSANSGVYCPIYAIKYYGGSHVSILYLDNGSRSSFDLYTNDTAISKADAIKQIL